MIGEEVEEQLKTFENNEVRRIYSAAFLQSPLLFLPNQIHKNYFAIVAKRTKSQYMYI